MSQRLSIILLTIANLLIPIAILVFATGFFPYKPFISGRASFEGRSNGSGHASAPFDKVIFMVVDALRTLGLPQLHTVLVLTLIVTSSIPIPLDSNSRKGQLRCLYALVER